MNVKKLVKVGLLTLSLTVAMSAAAFAATDTAGHWCEDVANKWERMGLLYGYPDGTARLDQYVDRAEAGAFIKRIGQYPNASVAPTFKDVSPDDWFYGDAATMAEQGIMSGYDADTFGPTDPVLREQMAVMERNIKNLPVDETRAYQFAEGEVISLWARGSVGAVANAGYMIGDTNNMFNGMVPMTRGEMISSLDRLFAIEEAPQGGEPSGEPATGEPSTPAAQGELAITLAGDNGSIKVDGVKTVNYDLQGDATVTAASSDESIATVAVDGTSVKITGVKQGTATITVTATDEAGNTATDTYDITVTSKISISSGGGGGGGGTPTYTIVLPAGTKVQVDNTPAGPIDFELAKDLSNPTKLNNEYKLTVGQLMAAVDPDSDAYAKLQKASEVKGNGYVLISGTVKAVDGAKVTDATWAESDGMTVVNGAELIDALQVK